MGKGELIEIHKRRHEERRRVGAEYSSSMIITIGTIIILL
jgi:hypothetical protein